MSQKPPRKISKHRVFLVDDHPIVLTGFTLMLNAQPDIEVCGTASSAEEGLRLLGERTPDLVFLDVRMPGLDGLQALPMMRAQYPAADVVIMNDNLQRVAETVRLSRQTHAVLWQNITLALGIKSVFLVLAVFGTATMWMAVFADMGASLLVVANGLRLLREARVEASSVSHR